MLRLGKYDGCNDQHFTEKLHKNHTVRLNGRVVDIPRRPDAARARYVEKDDDEHLGVTLSQSSYSVFP